MKKWIIAGIGTLGAGLAFYMFYMPRITIKYIDKTNKFVDYKISAGFKSMQGRQHLSSGFAKQQTAGPFLLKAESQNNVVTLSVYKSGRIKRVEYIHF